MPEELFFEKIEEHNAIYLTEYCPPMGSNNFATLNLIFLEDSERAEVTKYMQAELERWLRRYPVALMASAFDKKENIISLDESDKLHHLLGWVEVGTNSIVSSSKITDLTDHLHTTSPPSDWRSIYIDIPYRTRTEVSEAALKYVKEMRQYHLTLKFILLLWIAVLPACWAIIEFLGPQWLSLVVLIYTLYKILGAARGLVGRKKPSPREFKKAEKNRKMEHYYYHCERNPIGFARIKAENFEKDIQRDILKKASQLASKKAPQ